MPFQLAIVTPDGMPFQGQVDSVVLPGTEGDFGVLAGHERFLATLETGPVEIRTGAETLYAAIAPGFAQVEGDAVTVLVEACELASKIDVARAELARSRAQQQLAAIEASAAVQKDELAAALDRALNRLEVAKRAN